MELIRRIVPYDAAAALKLLEDTFGYEEVVVEAPQLMGAEAAVNKDIVWEAWEDGQLLGTIHVTIPKAAPASAVCPQWPPILPPVAKVWAGSSLQKL